MKGPDMNANTQTTLDAELEEAMRQILNATLGTSPAEERFAGVLDIIEKTLHRIESIQNHPSAMASLHLVEEAGQ
jgi:hypothetical protein